jgi:hypothetical protein
MLILSNNEKNICAGIKAMEVHRKRTQHGQRRHQNAGKEMVGHLQRLHAGLRTNPNCHGLGEATILARRGASGGWRHQVRYRTFCCVIATWQGSTRGEVAVHLWIYVCCV